MADISHIHSADEVYQPDIQRARVNQYVVRFDTAVDDACSWILSKASASWQAMVKK